MNIEQSLKPAFKKLTLATVIGFFCLGSVPQHSFAHGSIPQPPSYPPSSGSRPVPPPLKPPEIQAIRDRINQLHHLTPKEWDSVFNFDDRQLQLFAKNIERIYGSGSDSLTDKQKKNLGNWLIDALDRSGSSQQAMDDAEWYNSYGVYVENVGYVVTAAKIGVYAAAAITNPLLIPAIIAIDGTAGKVETAATGVGEFTAALQGGFTVENVITGAGNATLAVTIKIAGGKFVEKILPMPPELANKTKQELAMLAGDAIAQVLASQAYGDVAAEAQNILTAPAPASATNNSEWDPSYPPSVDTSDNTYRPHYPPPPPSNNDSPQRIPSYYRSR